MSISGRKAGTVVQCPMCGEPTPVPMEDIFEPQEVQREPPTPESQFPELPDLEPAATAEQPPAAEPPDTAVPPPVQQEIPGSLPNSLTGERIDAPAPDGTEVSEFPDVIDEASPEERPALLLRRRSLSEDEMDLTPMVDVTFQLLIFFMVTASFALQKSIDVPTPDPEKKGAAQQLQILEDLEGSSIRVQIDAANVILIDEEPLRDPARLPEALKDKMRKEQKTEILITADALALHRSVISVIDAANSAGMQKIRLVSRQGKSE